MTPEPELSESAKKFLSIYQLGSCPVFLADGCIGILIRWDHWTDELGVQVPGEDDIRWISVMNVKEMLGALQEAAK